MPRQERGECRNFPPGSGPGTGGFCGSIMQLEEFLNNLLTQSGVSGYENNVASAVVEGFRGLYDEFRLDPLGNLILLKKGEGRGDEPRPRVMLAAHMDEIGFVITKVEDEGGLRFSNIGGIDPRVLPGQEVIVHGKRDLMGVIGSKPPHIQDHDEAKKAMKREDMFIDVGLTRAELEGLVSVGDTATIYREPIILKDEFLAAKALDDRAGVGVLFTCLEELSRMRHLADVYCVSTVQEEVGIRGAIVGTYSIVPDVGIAVDVCHADMPGVPEYDTVPMDKGPALGFGPHVHPRIYERLVKTAEDAGIPYQVDPSPYPGGTDAWGIQMAREGIPTALVSIPLRYMHTSVEMVCLRDIKRSGRLLARFISGLDKDFLEGLKCF